MLIDGDVLFDTFCNARYLSNSLKKFGIAPGTIRHIVISHEHWDHTGGLWWLLQNTVNAKVYVCGGFSEDFKNRVKEYGGTLMEAVDPVTIKDNITTTGEIKTIYKGEALYEQSLLIEQNGRLAVLTGCSHPGILKILDRITMLGKNEIDLLAGGLHLLHKTDKELGEIAAKLDSDYKIKAIAPIHCSGKKAVAYFKNNMPHKFVKISPGGCFNYNGETSSRKQ